VLAVGVAAFCSPFLATDSFSSEVDTELPSVGYGPTASAAMRSPFVSVYEVGDEETAYDEPVREAYAGLLGELHDEEFDDALSELHGQARELHQQQLGRGVPRPEAERAVMQHFAPLVREAEWMVDAMVREFGPREGAGLVEGEIDAFVESYAPSASFEPQFEHLFGKVLGKFGKVLKTVASKAVQGIKKIGLGPLLSRIRALIKPMLNRVLQKAIGHLPAAVRPAAQQLAQKLGFASAPAPALAVTPTPAPDAAPADAAPPPDNAAVQDVAGADAPLPQQEFDQQVANAMLAQDEAQLEMEVAQSAAAALAPAQPVFAELDDAREQFIRELNELRPGESAQPPIESFLPAVLPALKLGIRLIGRPRVIGFLSPLLSKLIASLIGPQQAPALSRAIADAGLKLLNLEMTEDEEAGLGASAVAATVEETVRRVATLPDHVLDQPELLEGYALEAFEQAAAANLPALLSAGAYRQRPELLEAGVDAGWVMLPLHGHKRYKRCTRAFDVRITPYLTAEVMSFEGAPLADYLQDELGLAEGEEVDAQVHLFETLPGTELSDIARSERELLGVADAMAGARQLHPLTPQAAAALLGKPGLGRAFSNAAPQLAAGQRMYHLAIAGRRARPGLQGQAHRRRPMHLKLTFDCVSNQIRACVFLSEAKAQKLAMRLRQATNAGVLTSAFGRSLQARLQPIFFGEARRRLQVVSAGVSPTTAASMQNLPQAQAQRYVAALQIWLVQGFAQFIRSQAQQVIAATEHAADGVTLSFTVAQPPALKAVCDAMAGRGAVPGLAQALQQVPLVQVQAIEGHRCA
jgi:hypothetical protein